MSIAFTKNAPLPQAGSKIFISLNFFSSSSTLFSYSLISSDMDVAFDLDK